VEDHGFTALKEDTVVAPGVQLGRWVIRVRERNRKRRLPAWLHDGVEAIPGWTWSPVADRQRAVLRMLEGYVALARGWGNEALTVEHFHAIGKWIRMRRQDQLADRLDQDLRAELEALPGRSTTGMVMGARKTASKPQPLTGAQRRYEAHQRERIAALRSYVAEHGWLDLRGGRRYGIVANGIDLSRWLVHCRRRRNVGDLPSWVVAELESIPGWSWEARTTAHERFVSLLRRLVESVGDPERNVPNELVTIALFIDDAREKHRGRKLASEFEKALPHLPGWTWTGPAARKRRGR
jgi:hypothetical protein